MIIALMKNAVTAKEINKIRIILVNYLTSIDPDDTGEFEENYNYVLEHGITEEELYLDDNGVEYDITPTEDNLYIIGSEAKVNFSRKKIEDLKKMRSILVPEKTDESTAESHSEPEQSAEKKTQEENEVQKSKTENNHQYKKTPIALGAVGGALVAGATATALAAKTAKIAGTAIAILPIVGITLAGAALGAATVLVVLKMKGRN